MATGNQGLNGRIVLLPHPGAEAIPFNGAADVPWNTGQHRRKFLECEGAYVKDRGVASQAATLRFWCEYEPPTEVTNLRQGHQPPRYLHRIVQWPSTVVRSGSGSGCTPRGGCQNTDPWIWREGFVWTICRHHQSGKLRRLVRELRSGDLILFGSPSKTRWLLDTVLVVGEGLPKPMAYATVRANNKDPLYAAAVLDPLAPSSLALMPIHGQSQRTAGASAPFSFVPSVRRADQSWFERPDIADLVHKLTKSNGGAKPALNSAQSATECLFADGPSAFWHLVVDKVASAGLVMGTRFDFPIAVHGIET